MRKYSVLTATISVLLLALISTPAHASVPPNGTYLCTTGVASSLTPNFTITSGVVSAGNSCAGAVVIPAGVTSIGSGAFAGATGLTSMTIPASVTSIGSGAFYRATGLTSMTIPASVTSIGSEAFSGATGLTSITFAAGSVLTSIGDYAFYRATGLTSMTIPASVTSIGSSAFAGATGLTSITIPASVTSIGSSAFQFTTPLTSITFAAGSLITSIGDYAFFGATGLTSMTIPASVTSIGSSAFQDTTSLASAYFLANAPTVGTNAYRADKLATVYFAPLSSKLSKAAKKQIEAAVIANPSAVYKVTGYVQKSIFARNAKNDSSLSLARAKAIETHLESLGAGVTFTVVVDGAGVPAKNGKSNKARRATLYAMTPVVQ